MIAFIILLLFTGSDIAISAVKNGQPREGEFNFLVTLITVIIQWVLIYYICQSGILCN